MSKTCLSHAWLRRWYSQQNSGWPVVPLHISNKTCHLQTTGQLKNHSIFPKLLSSSERFCYLKGLGDLTSAKTPHGAPFREKATCLWGRNSNKISISHWLSQPVSLCKATARSLRICFALAINYRDSYWSHISPVMHAPRHHSINPQKITKPSKSSSFQSQRASG